MGEHLSDGCRPGSVWRHEAERVRAGAGGARPAGVCPHQERDDRLRRRSARSLLHPHVTEQRRWTFSVFECPTRTLGPHRVDRIAALKLSKAGGMEAPVGLERNCRRLGKRERSASARRLENIALWYMKGARASRNTRPVV